MKRFIWPVLFSFLMLSCTSEVCELRITARATNGINDFTYYSCVLEQDGTILETGSRDGTFEFLDIHEGRIAITMNAYSEESQTEFIGSAEMVASGGLNELEIFLTPREPLEKDMVLHFPESSGSYATLTVEGTETVLMKDVPIRNSRMDLTALSFGRYRITVTTEENGKTRKSSYSFTCSDNTPEELIFLRDDDDERRNGNVTFDFFDISSSPIEGRISLVDMNDRLVLEIQILKTKADVNEDDLEFLWYRNGNYISTGRRLEIEKCSEVVRFDCVMKSRYLGSYGSESLNISISR